MIQDENRYEAQTVGIRSMSQKKSGVVLTAANLANTIVGSGIITLSYGFGLSGVTLGLILMYSCALMSDYTITALVKSACVCKRSSYQGVVSSAFGKVGTVIISVCHFLIPFFGVVAYGVSVSDNLINVISNSVRQDSIFLSRPVLMLIPTTFLVFPLSSLPNLSFLDKVSGISIVFVVIYSLFIVIKAIVSPTSLYVPNDMWNLGHLDFFRSLGIYAFSMSCHFSVIPLYKSLRNPNVPRFTISSHLAIGLTLIIYTIVSIAGFINFSGQAEGNMFNNYCTNDLSANVARMIFVTTIILTAPTNIIGLRETFNYFLHSKIKGLYLNLFTAFAGSLIFYIPGSIRLDLGFVGELSGSISAAPMVFILPAACLLRLSKNHIPYWSLRKLFMIFIVLFGLVVQILGTSLAIYTKTIYKPSLIRYWCLNTPIIPYNITMSETQIADLWK